MLKDALLKNLQCYVDWSICDRKHSRPIWSTMWIIKDDREWCLYLIWGGLLIGTDMKECCHGLIWSAIWIGNYVTGKIHYQFEVLCGVD
jgi:hypothetical protein